MALTKGADRTLYAIASTASNDATNGTALDVSDVYNAGVRIRMGRGTGTAFTVAPTIRLQVTGKTSPTENDWATIAAYSPQLGTSVASQAVSGTVSAGATTFGVAASTNFAAGDCLFLHNTTIANSEFVRLKSISGTTITPIAALVNAQTGSTCRDQSEEYSMGFVDFTPYQKARLQVDGSGSGQAVVVEAALVGVVTGL
jgi:hypothetical protein